MERKFLVFSCLVLLISIVYFIYTSYQLHTKYNKQQEVAAQSEAPFVTRVSTTRSFSTNGDLQSLNLNPTLEEQEDFKDVLNGEIEVPEEQVERIQLEVWPETEDSHTGIYPELEIMFARVRNIKVQKHALVVEVANLYIEDSEIQTRQIEIGMKELLMADEEEARRLHDELKMLHNRRVELDTILDPYDQQIEELDYEFEHEYGMSFHEFHERYGLEYDSWVSNY